MSQELEQQLADEREMNALLNERYNKELTLGLQLEFQLRKAVGRIKQLEQLLVEKEQDNGQLPS